ncbi:hypothetical protein IFR05_007594 [Cadophora sp. M221]|nr:hypothetical protein IFR05_007594 [Cadophora sp. M221]
MSRIKDLISKFAVLDLEEGPGLLTSFLPFPRLPLELRQKIWKEVCSVPRVVSLLHSGLSSGPSVSCKEKLKSQLGVPAVFHVCTESRNEGKIYYTVVLNRVYRQKLRDGGVQEVPAGARMVRQIFPGHKECGFAFSIYPYTYGPTPQLTETPGVPSTNRMYFINFEVDIFWHPHVDPLADKPVVVLSALPKPGTTFCDVVAKTVPIGQPIYEGYNFTKSVLSRIQNLLLPTHYDPEVFTALQKQYFLYEARPAKLKQIIFELSLRKSMLVAETVDGNLTMFAREKKLTELVEGIPGRPKGVQGSKNAKNLRTVREIKLGTLTALLENKFVEHVVTLGRPDPPEYEKIELSYPFENARLSFKWIPSVAVVVPPACVNSMTSRRVHRWIV